MNNNITNLTNKIAVVTGGSGGSSSRQIINPALKGSLQGAESGSALSTIASNAFTLGIMVGLIGFIMYFILGAINWILSKGDKMKLENARNQIMHAFIGVIVLISVYAVIKLIEISFGLDILNLDFGSLIIK